MAVGFILRGYRWAADGSAIVPHPAMKVHNPQTRNCENFAISVTLRVVPAYRSNVLAMP
jgi:hypothetical protein